MHAEKSVRDHAINLANRMFITPLTRRFRARVRDFALRMLRSLVDGNDPDRGGADAGPAYAMAAAAEALALRGASHCVDPVAAQW